MNKAEQFIRDRLHVRAEIGTLRQLSYTKGLIDFCSNDYLGFARSARLKTSIEDTLSQLSNYSNGTTGSRRITGNHPFTESTEAFIAEFHHAESGLLFNSGYDANVGLISCLGQRGDTIISDELIHASLIDGARLTHAHRFTFKHNNLTDLEGKLKAARGNIYVLVESVYSMDGDIAPLQEISALCDQHQANLIVDEAHALGIFGDHGSGLVQDLGLENKIFARVVTFGKALGCHGAMVLGSSALRDYLINFARSFIYTTAAPLHSIAAIKCGYEALKMTDYSQVIRRKIDLYRSAATDAGLSGSPVNSSAIQTVLFNTNAAAKSAAYALQQKGLDLRAILSPTVPEGKNLVDEIKHLTPIS